MTFNVEVPPNLLFTNLSVNTISLLFSKFARKLEFIHTLVIPYMDRATITAVIMKIVRFFSNSARVRPSEFKRSDLFVFLEIFCETMRLRYPKRITHAGKNQSARAKVTKMPNEVNIPKYLIG